MGLRAIDVFTPGTYPVHNYVERIQQGLEQALRDGLDTPGQLVSLSGPSKSGKTVLVERVVSRDLLIPISGASIERAQEVWTRVLDWMDTPETVITSHSNAATVGAEVEGKGSLGLPLVGKAEVGVGGHFEGTTTSATSTERSRRGLERVVAEIGNSGFVVFLDDFHYMPRDIQTEVAKTLKDGVRREIKIVTAAVSHRGDDVLRANPELRGRVKSIDLQYWSKEELAEIAKVGFGALNARVSDGLSNKFTTESAGSPQLMQSLCLHTCFVLNLRQAHDGIFPEVIDPTPERLNQILEQTSASADFRSLVDVLDNGPRTRGTERKTYKFRDGGQGDVYTVILKAVAADPPQLAFSYDELLERAAKVCEGESPVGSSVITTCSQMAKIALDKFPRERTIDWDESKSVFDLPDPYLMFYLRWSGRLRNTE
ncbi:MAG: hypothetical protein WBA18_21160 [Terracidiphilus sp.]